MQKISEKILAESSNGDMCGICYEKVVPRPVPETLWAPCCQKNGFFHRDCVQVLHIVIVFKSFFLISLAQ